MRGMIIGLRPELNLSQSGSDEYQLQMITPHVTKTVTFKSGDTVDQTSIVGKTVKVSESRGQSPWKAYRSSGEVLMRCDVERRLFVCSSKLLL